MTKLGIAFVVLSLIMVGCSGSKTRQSNVTEYWSNLRVHVQPTSSTAFNGVLEPKFRLTITNTGGKRIRQIKIVGDVSHGDTYHDTVVKISKDKIKENGGQLEIDFAFKKSDKMPDAQVLLNQLKYGFTVQELDF